jgi:hypothetical protein
MRLNVFTLSFLCCVGLFISANIYSYHQAVPPCCDASISFGVPFELGRVGGYVGGTSIRMSGLIADALIAICGSLILGWAVERLFRLRTRLP